MTTSNATLPNVTMRPASLVQAWFSRMWAFNKFLTLSVLIYIGLIPIFAIAAIVDQRLITNAPAFVKPLKFIISIAIYLATFLWLLTLVEKRRLWVQIVANVTALALLIEIVLITGQAIRGTTSHYNQTTSFDAMVFNIMGAAIVLVSLMNLILAIWLIFQRLPDPVIAWALRLGVLLSFVGMITAFQMTSTPSQGQRAQLQAGERPTAIGAHSIGVEDGGPGLPFVGWSTTGGDLRVAHFLGLHAIQFLPLVAFALNRRRTLNQRQRLVLVITAGAAYLGWMALLTWQALRGQSIIAPDAMTLTAYAALLGCVILIAAVTLSWRTQPQPSRQGL